MIFKTEKSKEKEGISARKKMLQIMLIKYSKHPPPPDSILT